MYKKLLKISRTLVNWCCLGFRDTRAALQLSQIPLKRNGDITYRGICRSELSVLNRLYTQMSGANGLPFYRRCVYWLVGKRLVIVAIFKDDGIDRLVGIDMFYFNKRDICEKTVHEGFIGVDSTFRGRGVATELRRNATAHFYHSGLEGISTRIDTANQPSLKSALNIGFRPVEKYWDDKTSVERYYLIKWLADLNDNK